MAMDRYRLIEASDARDGERQMNELSRVGYQFLSLAPARDSASHLFIVMENIGGWAGTVADEARQGGIPSQGPTAERQLMEETLGTGQL
jgi:hypothetical protein